MVAGWLVLLLAALSLVTWRQTRGVEMERALHSLESQRMLVEAERVASRRRIEELGSRSRIVRVARDRLGMHLPEDQEIVFLPAVEAGSLAAAATGGTK
jgi:cell division protein FtsL